MKCDKCGKEFDAGNRPDGRPNGVGFQMEDGSVINYCADCLTQLGEEKKMKKGFGVFCITKSMSEMKDLMDIVKDSNCVGVHPATMNIVVIVFTTMLDANAFLEKAKEICICGHRPAENVAYGDVENSEIPKS